MDNTQEQQSSGIWVYILSIILVGLLGLIGYTYYTKDIIKKDEIKNDYVKKDDIAFDMLPSYVQSNYISKVKYDNKVYSMEERIKQLSSISDIQQNSAKSIVVPKLLEIEIERVVEKEVEVEKIVEKIVEVEKVVEVEKIVEKIVEVERIVEKPIEIEKIVEVEKIIEIEKKVEVEKVVEKIIEIPVMINKNNYSTYTCKTLKNGSKQISKKCKKDLIEFLDKNQDAKMYVVIGMVDDFEFKLIKTLKDVYGKNRVGNIAKYAQKGLSRQRVIEATWIVKNNVAKNANIKNVNYTIDSKDKRGFVVRVYK